MGSHKRKSIPITSAKEFSASASSPNTRSVIRRFHALLKAKSQLQQQNPLQNQKLLEIDAEILRLGGLDGYQRMSKIGQSSDRGGGSEKILIGWLKELETITVNAKLKLLEVGALKPDNYRFCQSWIENTPIDLKSQHPDIVEQDFFTLNEIEKWDVISLSLVLNFVPNVQDRGRMLRSAHKQLKRDGLLFLVLPLSCVRNSRYLNFDHLKTLMEYIGFNMLKERWKPHGKMAYWLFRKGDSLASTPAGLFEKKTVIVNGANRNNFAILL